MSNGRILWQGRSLLTQDQIVVIVTGYKTPTQNRKTGNMLQMWILPVDENPAEAVKTGLDSSVCGDCPLKPSNTGICYVRTWDAPNQIWKCWKRGGYPVASHNDIKWLHTQSVRFGSYGDPAAIPYELLKRWHGENWTCYTHQWRICDQRLKEISMASCETESDIEKSRKKGWIPFVAVKTYKDMPKGLLPCLATVGNEIQCVQCGLCKGTATKLSPKFRGIAIETHGKNKNQYDPSIMDKYRQKKGKIKWL